MKRSPIEWEKIFSNNAKDNKLISKIYKQFILLNVKITNNTTNGQKNKIDIILKKTYRWSIGTRKDAQHC